MTQFEQIQSHLLTYNESDSIYYTNANGCTFIDEKDNEYLCLNEISIPLGYAHTTFTNRVSELMKTKMMGHISNLSKDKEQLIQNIINVTHHDFSKVFIAGIGGEVVDWSIKIARNKTGKDGIISFHNALHGRSFAGAFLSGIDRRKKGFGTGLENVYFYDYGIIEDYNKNNDIAAIIIEPYQALGGMISPSKEYLQWLRKYTKENNIVLIFDEIQTGFGKTGTFFAYEQMNVIPDILIMGKGMSNGFSISALLTHDDIVSNMNTSALAGGSSDNDLFCSIVNTVFDIYKEEKILEHVREMHDVLIHELEPFIISKGWKLQGNGLFMSIVLEEGKSSEIVSKCKQNGVLFGKTDTSIMIRPPLVITKEELKHAIDILKDACS